MSLYEVTTRYGRRLAVVDARSKVQAGNWVKAVKRVKNVNVFPVKIVRSLKPSKTNILDLNRRNRK